jgi:fatty-acyl-CoA synthase
MSLDCTVELVSNNSLPKTSSGKLSRAKARLNFIALHRSNATEDLPLQAGNA